jgi:methionine biosynthesis protein MetW
MPTSLEVSPDSHGKGLSNNRLDPLRYDGHTDDPLEVAGLLRSLMPERVRVLDVGCGTGSVTLIANANKYNEVVGVEPDSARSAVACSRGLDVTCGFLNEKLITNWGEFDVVVLADVLEHLPEPDAMLRLAIRALRPGGIVLLSVPNVAHWSLRLKLLLGQFDYAETGICDSTHLRWFTKRSIQRLLFQQGWEVLGLRFSAGNLLPVYSSKMFHIFPNRLRRKVLGSLTKLFPTMFGCQFIIKARRPL